MTTMENHRRNYATDHCGRSIPLHRGEHGRFRRSNTREILKKKWNDRKNTRASSNGIKPGGVLYFFTLNHPALHHRSRRNRDSPRLEGEVPVERDTRRVPPHSTLKPFFSKTRFRRVRHWYSEGAPVILVPPAFIREAVWSPALSLSLFFLAFSVALSLSGRRSIRKRTKSPPCTRSLSGQ